METLKEKTAKGLFWGMMNNGTMQLLNIVLGIFLRHLHGHSQRTARERLHRRLGQ